MSETTATLPTVRLLEPRALVAADRAAASIQARSAFLLRNVEGGALRFASRMFDYWIGRPADERTPSMVAARSPGSLQLARPWYELPSTWPKKGIVLGGATVRSETPRTRAPAGDVRALELVQSYAPVEALDDEPSSARRVPLPVARPLVGAPVALAARLAARLGQADRMIARPAHLPAAVRATEPAPFEVSPFERVHVELPVAGAAQDASLRAAVPRAASAPRAGALASLTSRSVATGSTSPLGPSLVPGALVAPGPIGLSPRIEHALPTAWPRIQHFIEALAGPAVLARAGALVPADVIRREAPRREGMFRDGMPHDGDVRAIAPFARELVVLSEGPAGDASIGPRGPRRAAPAATSVGEVARSMAPPAIGLPGRVAQHAELIAAVAEQRVDRQLGLPRIVGARSVRRSADAFTVLSLGANEPASRELAFASPDPAPHARAARPTPMSIAAILAFADAQVGSRLVAATRPLPLLPPSPVYVAPFTAVPAPVRTDGRAVSLAVAATAPARPAALELPGWQPLGMPAALTSSPAPGAPLGFSAGQLGLRSEQLAGTVGLRAASLASEFVFESDAEAAAAGGALADPAVAQAARRGWLSTNEWALLSLFPSQATALQIARTVERRADAQLSLVTAAQGSRPGTAPERAASAATITMERGSSSAIGPVDAVVPSAREVSRAPLVMLLPDGRTPRGNRLAARAPAQSATRVEHGMPMHLVAGAEAAERRVDAPVGGPLWGHLVAPEAPPRGMPAPRDLGRGRSVALELLAPYLEAAPAPSTAASSFARAGAAPPVPARASDDSTRSLVTALQTSSSQGATNDRLSMADMTLISIVAATEQIAASRNQGTTKIAAPKAAPKTTRQGPSSGGQRPQIDVDEMTDRITAAIRRRMRNDHGNSGRGQE